MRGLILVGKSGQSTNPMIANVDPCHIIAHVHVYVCESITILSRKEAPPFSAVDMAQTGEGAYFRVRATRLEYKPPISSQPIQRSSSHRTESILVLSSNAEA